MASPLTNDAIEAISARLDLREPNKEALQHLAFEMDRHFEVEAGEAPWEAVIDAATGVGKTFIIAAAIEYYAGLGTRNFAVITPGKTILKKTVANFTDGDPKSVLGGMEVEPVLITSENFASPAMRAAMDDPTQVKLFVFTVQSLTKPKTDQGRKTHKFQEGLGRAFYEHLDAQDDLIVFADEHHTYHGPAFSKAIRDLTPHALVGLTATPDEKKLTKDSIPIIYRYPLAAAIANEYVKTPVIVGRKDDLSDPRTKLADGVRLLKAKKQAVENYCAQTGAGPVNPMMLVVASNIEDADEFGAVLKDSGFPGGAFEDDEILVVHSKAADDALEALDHVEDPGSPVRVIISVGMLKEGWDVKSVYVIASMRASISDVLTEQTLGRGLRLPWGKYTDYELLDTLEVVAHERYDELLKRSGVINEAFIDWRTRAVERRNAQGESVVTIEREPVQLSIVPGAEGGPSPVPVVEGGEPVIETVEKRAKQVEKAAKVTQEQLKLRLDAPELYLPRLKLDPVKNAWSLNDVIEFEPYRSEGRRIAADPSSELRRQRLGAHVITGADGIRRTELSPTKAIDDVEAQPSLLPLEDAKRMLLDVLLGAPVVPARAGERQGAGRIVDAFVEGLGGKADAVLGGHLERAAAALIDLVMKEQREAAGKVSFEEKVTTERFDATRLARAETSTDRVGKFKRGCGYLGYKKSMYEQEWFDSSTERTLANLLDDEDEIEAWLRLQRGELEIHWEGGTYNPDFVAIDGPDTRWVIEVKSDKDMPTDTVQAKRTAAMRWANRVSASEAVKDEWRYVLCSESDISAAKGTWSALAALAS